MRAQEHYKTFITLEGRALLTYCFTTEEGNSFYAVPCDLTQARRMRDRWLELRKEPRCTRCGQVKPHQVEKRYSFGVYAGRLCVSCCAGYRDNCGLDQPQGDPRVLMLEGESYWEDYADAHEMEGGVGA